MMNQAIHKTKYNMLNNIIKLNMKTGLGVIFNLVLAFVLICGLFYLRLLPRVSRDLWVNMDYFQLFITLFSIFVLLFHCYFCLVVLGYIKTKQPIFYPQILHVTFCRLLEYLQSILRDFYRFLWFVPSIILKNVFGYKYFHYNVIRNLALKTDALCYSTYYCWFLTSIKLIPKFVFTIVVVYEVFICHHLDLTFKCIPLLLIPLLETLIIYIFDDFYNQHKDNIYSFMKITTTPDNSKTTYSFIDEFVNRAPDFVQNFNDYYHNHYMVLKNVRENLDFYQIWRYGIFPFTHMILFLCVIRLCSFCYILIHGII